MIPSRFWQVLCGGVLVWLGGVDAVGGAEVEYLRDIKPILRERCYACHGALKQESKLRLDTATSVLKGGESGSVVVDRNDELSPLIVRITSPDPAMRMPPEGAPLTAEQIAAMRSWVRSGVEGVSQEVAEADPRDHWSFRPVQRPPLPPLETLVGGVNPIDLFLEARLRQAGLTARPEADRATWLRRVTLDLIGVPPTPAELQDFTADESPAAQFKVVDRLLDDPRYGERWGRHWLDVWRYADWHGRRHVPDVWNSAPQIWRWRDWTVRSLNADHGYDRLIREMLAADELAPDDSDATVATGFLIRNWYALNPNDWMRANVEHVGKAFLGLTFNCAHCHDHKYDPITQDDYFRLRAFFEPINIRQDRVVGEADPGPFQEYSYGVLRKIQRLGAVQVYDKTPGAATWFYTGGDERNRVQERGSVAPGLPAFLAPEAVSIVPVELPPYAFVPSLRPAMRQALLAEQDAMVAAAEGQRAAVVAEATPRFASLRANVAAAKTAWEAEKSALAENARVVALAGQQSLLFDATRGRRILQHRLGGLRSVEDGTTISFRLRVIQDSHVNFQLAKDLVQGLTAGYVAFERGRIRSYQPGSFTEFEVGKYDLAAGQRSFEIRLVLETKADRALLTVRNLDQDQLLVDKQSVALNGWNPVGDVKKGISFDARPGTIAAVDEVVVTRPSTTDRQGEPWMSCGFEEPDFPRGRDAVGQLGWEASPFGESAGASVVTSLEEHGPPSPTRQQLIAAERALAQVESQVKGAEARVAAVQATRAAFVARAEADQLKYGVEKSSDLDAKARAASRLHRESAVRVADADVLDAERNLAAVETRPDGDAKRAQDLTAARQTLTAAQTALAAARQKLADEQAALEYPSVGVVYPRQSTGRRRALAEWMTRRDNPLVARVAVNHIWMRHFHAPLVASVFDFGRNGTAPTHPELLDWLAVELMESGWSMKHLHRLMVTSAAYRRVSSTGEPARYASDPENRLLWRMNAGRMEAEVVRDSLLYVAGRLVPRIGGQELENDQALTTYRRTLYYSCQPELDGKSSLGALFDAPEPADCYRRTRSVIPQQALALTNSDLVHALSRDLAADLRGPLGSETNNAAGPFAATAFQVILGRPPTAAESQACLDFLTATSGDDRTRRQEGLIRVLLNHNDFVSIR